MSSDLRTSPAGPTPVINALLFIGLNVVDALVTRWTIFCGGQEMFWWSASFNSAVTIKILLASAVALAMVWLGKEKVLLYLNAGMGFVVLWNGINVVAYLIGRHNLV